MPVYIADSTDTTVFTLFKGEWDINQFYSLEEWIGENRDKLLDGKYIAHVSFKPSKDDTTGQGGGPVISIAFMKTLIELGMEIYICEYMK